MQLNREPVQTFPLTAERGWQHVYYYCCIPVLCVELIITDSVIFIRHQNWIYHNAINSLFFILAGNNLPVHCIGNLKDSV